MDALECISTRRSIRRYTQEPVDQQTIMNILEAGALAPSSGNIQDWRFVLVDEPSLKESISNCSLGQECVHNAAFLVVVCADPIQTERQYGLRGERLYTIQNCAAACQNMLLAAHAMGLGATWVGAFDEEKLRFLLSIPGEVRPQAILTFGYPAEKPDYKLVKDLRFITFFNKYGLRLTKPHRVLRDYSEDWSQIIKKGEQAGVKAGEKAKSAGASLKQKSKDLFSKYKIRLQESLKKRR